MSNPRIVAGKARGVRLKPVPGDITRPITDRVKVSLFNIFGADIQDATFLDLFGGTGSVGIEALSRGAASVLFVEEDRQSIAAIEKNLAKTNLIGRVRQQEVFDFLRRSSLAETFRIIFADPPYEKTKSGERFTERLLANAALAQLLEPGGVFVLEKRPTERISETELWNVVRVKTYGATEVLFLRHAPSALRIMPAGK